MSKTQSRQASELRFTSLKLENWKNFKKVDVLLPRRVLLVGANASGKSNLLDVFRFLHDLAGDIGGGFQEAVNRKRGGVSRIRSLAARRYPDVAIEVTLGSDEEPFLWRYRLAFGQDNQRRPQITHESVHHRENEVFSRPDDEDRLDKVRLTQTYLEQIVRNRDFREVAEFFRSVQYLHVVPQLMRDPERSVGRINDPFGGDFLERVARVNDKTRKAWLKRIGAALRVAVPMLEEIEFIRGEKGTPHLRGKYRHWRPQGAWQNEEQFSDGTLRLIGLLWSILDGSGPLLLEEPELSLHAEAVRHLPAIFHRASGRTGRQIMLSTHSDSLLRDGGIGLDEVLMLTPGEEGTIVRRAADDQQAIDLIKSGFTMADVVIPKTGPDEVGQLALFE